MTGGSTCDAQLWRFCACTEPIHEEYVKSSLTSAEALLGIIGQVLDYSKLEHSIGQVCGQHTFTFVYVWYSWSHCVSLVCVYFVICIVSYVSCIVSYTF